MPRLRHQHPTYRHHRASGQAVVTLDGHDFYLGLWQSKASRAEYDRLVGQWLANYRRLPIEVGCDLTIVELLAAYWQFARKYYVKNGRPTKTLGTIRRVRDLIRERHANERAIDFGPRKLRSLQDDLIVRGLSRSYINKIADIVRRMFRWAVAEELVPASVDHALRAVPGLRKGRTQARETPPVLPVDDATVDRTLPHLPPIVQDMVRFQRYTGCRPEEVCMLRPCDVDTSAEVWSFVPATHKTEHHGRRRVIFIGPKAQAILRPYLLRDKNAHCFVPAEAELRRRALAHEARKTPLSCGNRPGTNRVVTPKRPPGSRYTTPK